MQIAACSAVLRLITEPGDREATLKGTGIPSLSHSTAIATARSRPQDVCHLASSSPTEAPQQPQPWELPASAPQPKVALPYAAHDVSHATCTTHRRVPRSRPAVHLAERGLLVAADHQPRNHRRRLRHRPQPLGVGGPEGARTETLLAVGGRGGDALQPGVWGESRKGGVCGLWGSLKDGTGERIDGSNRSAEAFLTVRRCPQRSVRAMAGVSSGSQGLGWQQGKASDRYQVSHLRRASQVG